MQGCFRMKKKKKSQSSTCLAASVDSPSLANWPTPRANDGEKRGVIALDPRNGLPGLVENLEPSPFPKSTNTRAQYSHTDSRASQTSAAFATSHAIHFLAQQVSARLTSLLAASRASRTASQDLEKPTKMTEIYGVSAQDCFGTFDRALHSLKMLADCSRARTYPAMVSVQAAFFSTAYCQTWPSSGMVCYGKLFRLPPLVRLTDAIECGSSASRNWLTPTVVQIHRKDFAKTIAYFASIGRKYGERCLEEQMQNWQTPTTQEVEHPYAELTETNGRRTSTGDSHSLNLADSVLITYGPHDQGKTNTDGNRPGAWKAEGRPEDTLCGQVKATTDKLNPTWVESLMGFPPNWTQLPYNFTRKVQRKIESG